MISKGWIILLLSPSLYALSPPTQVRAYDTPNDGGGSITVEWKVSPDDSLLRGYEIFRLKGSPEAKPVSCGFVLRGITHYQDTEVKDGENYFYFVRAWKGKESADSEITLKPALSSAQWFNLSRKGGFVILLAYALFLIIFIFKAKRGIPLFIRKIAGLEAIDEAVGRSTETGKPILYILGLGFVSDIPTLAGLAILKRVAKKAALYETDIIVPNYDPIVMVAAQETVKEGYTEAGRPDLYKEGNIYYLTSDQFGYAAGVDGIMMRERPGAIFLQGLFYAESLILAETGHSVGAIQIAGTTAVTQLPFFVAACDYTLIGEEMYAATAYLDKDPPTVGSLKGEDIAKVSLVILMLLGTAFETIALLGGPSFLHLLKNFFNMF